MDFERMIALSEHSPAFMKLGPPGVAHLWAWGVNELDQPLTYMHKIVGDLHLDAKGPSNSPGPGGMLHVKNAMAFNCYKTGVVQHLRFADIEPITDVVMGDYRIAMTSATNLRSGDTLSITPERFWVHSVPPSIYGHPSLPF